MLFHHRRYRTLNASLSFTSNNEIEENLASG
jgi:hypothetical protein